MEARQCTQALLESNDSSRSCSFYGTTSLKHLVCKDFMLSLFTGSIDVTMWRGISAGAGRLLATTLIINIRKISAFWGHGALHHLSPGVQHYQAITSNRTQVIKQINSPFSLMMILKKSTQQWYHFYPNKNKQYVIYVYIWFSGHGHYIDWLLKNVRHQEQQMLLQTSSTSSTRGGPLSNF